MSKPLSSRSADAACEKHPSFRLSLVSKPGRHILEQQPRFEVQVNGVPQGELYFNMKGYAGTLPTVHGSRMDIGERGISAFRKEVAVLNREAREAIKHGATDARRLLLTRPTTDRSVLFGLSRDIRDGTEEMHFLLRYEVLQARRLFGSEDVGVGFFSCDDDPAAGPVVLLDESDATLAANLPDIRSRIMCRAEAETHQRYVEHTFKTTDDQVQVIISRRVMDDSDAEPEYVNSLSLELAQARYGDAMRLSDLQISDERPAVVDDKARSMLARDFTWFEVDGRQIEESDPEP